MSETADCFLHGPFDPALKRCPHPDHGPETRHYEGQLAFLRQRNEALARQSILEAECERLRAALTEACDWLDADLAHAPDTSTSMADRELVASWRAALGEAGGE